MDNLNTIRTIQGLLNQAIVELRHLEFTIDAEHSFDVECIKSGIMAERRALVSLKNSEKSKQETKLASRS